MTSEETSVHKLAYVISIQDGGERRRIYINMHILWGERKRLQKKFMCFCQELEVNFILTTKKNILPYPFKYAST